MWNNDVYGSNVSTVGNTARAALKEVAQRIAALEKSRDVKTEPQRIEVFGCNPETVRNTIQVVVYDLSERLDGLAGKGQTAPQVYGADTEIVRNTAQQAVLRLRYRVDQLTTCQNEKRP